MLRLRLLVLFLQLAIVLTCLSPSNSGGYTPAGPSTTSSSKSAAEVLHHISAPQRSLLSKKSLHEATASTAYQGAVLSPPRCSLNKVPVPPSAPNPYIPAATTSQSASVGHSMPPPRRLLNKVPPHVPPSKPNPGTLMPGYQRRHLLKEAPAPIPGTQIRGHSRPWLERSPVPPYTLDPGTYN